MGASSACWSEPTRRRWLRDAAWLALGTQVGCAELPTVAERPVVPGRVVPFLLAPPDDDLPAGWHAHLMRRDRAPTDYRLCERDGRRVLQATADGSSSGLRCDVDIDAHQSPWLQWQWRVDEFPAGAAVADDERDDSPARLVLAFDGDVSTLGARDLVFRDLVKLLTGKSLPFATLMYVWDGEAATESVIAYPRSARIQYLVVESGAQRAGRWLDYRRNVVEDYRRVFGSDPGPIRHVGVLSDSDDLKRHVEAWFGDIVFAAA